jgi:hypothetical protein
VREPLYKQELQQQQQQQQQQQVGSVRQVHSRHSLRVREPQYKQESQQQQQQALRLVLRAAAECAALRQAAGVLVVVWCRS